MNQPREPKGAPGGTGGRFRENPASGVSGLPGLDMHVPLNIAGRRVAALPVGSAPLDGCPVKSQPKEFFRLDRGRPGAVAFRDCLKSIHETKYGKAVDVHPVEDYEDCDLYVTEDGRTGFALRGDELISVFSLPGEHGGDAAVAQAVRQGARRLDCYDIGGGLPAFYARHGFRPIARVAWDDEYAPDDWPAVLGRPDVVAMAVTDNPPDTPPVVEYDEALLMAARAADEKR